MRVNIFSCLVAFILGCNVTAEILHEIVEENTAVSLRCPHSVSRDVTWSREIDGNKSDILTVAGDGEIKHITDPGRRYSSLVDNSLVISRVTTSDSGRYFCNNEAAVELTVIPSGTIRRDATEGTSVNLTCPHDFGGSGPTWSRGSGDIQQQKGFYVSPVDNMLIITTVALGHSGLYYCGGKPAVYLNVIKDVNTSPTTITSAPKPTTKYPAGATTAPSAPLKTTAMTPTKNEVNKMQTTAAATTEPPAAVTETASPYLWQMWVRTAIIILYLITMISITATYWRKAQQISATHNRNRR